ncbi:DUF1707 SHOCT-like domain-containing protein [Corynebacterium testudinoris]|uniref:DUF1707 SHOCT-like domain-containing protein n=1 Tax=Corynebacterium testudinoris TaxID=136857 RepID=UPI001F340BCD|nr:DUF1707 domain-containing protein [Corynebacterium testudinoris]
MNGSYQSQGFSNGRVRLSDEERQSAMAALGRAFSEGRLSIDEYDERCQEIAGAQFHGELEPLFVDLPQHRQATSTAMSTLYSAQEIETAYREGRRTRFGVFGLTTVGATAAAIAFAPLTSGASTLLFFLIPAVFILLYVMKVGPESWHMPSARAVDRQRIRELRTMEQLRATELRLAEQDRLAELRAERKVQTAELTNKAMGFVNRTLENRRK